MNRLDKIMITSINSVGTIPSPKGRFDKMENRICYGISFCISGRITYTHKGKKYVSDRDHAILLPKGQSYSIHGDESGYFPVINFFCTDSSFFTDEFIVYKLQNTESYLKDYERIKLLSLFDKNQAKTMSVFYDMISRLVTDNLGIRDILNPAITLLEQNYSDSSLSNASLATAANISEVYFRRLFKEAYNMSPHQYLLDIRIRRAKQLLAENLYSVTTISEQCGFSSVYHFCRVFKQITGQTPTEYMKYASPDII